MVSGPGVATVLQEGTFTGHLSPFGAPWQGLGMKNSPRGKEVEAMLPRMVSLLGAGELHS